MCQDVFFFSFAVVPIVLVGNKKDLFTNTETKLRLAARFRDPIDTMEGLAIARKINASAYLEVSVKENAGVREVLELAARATLPKQKRGISCLVFQ